MRWTVTAMGCVRLGVFDNMSECFNHSVAHVKPPEDCINDTLRIKKKFSGIGIDGYLYNTVTQLVGIYDGYVHFRKQFVPYKVKHILTI